MGFHDADSQIVVFTLSRGSHEGATTYSSSTGELNGSAYDAHYRCRNHAAVRENVIKILSKLSKQKKRSLSYINENLYLYRRQLNTKPEKTHYLQKSKLPFKFDFQVWLPLVSEIMPCVCGEQDLITIATKLLSFLRLDRADRLFPLRSAVVATQLYQTSQPK